MGKQAFGKALESMANDSHAAAAVAGGDFAAVASDALTSAERDLLQAAAHEMPDVSGFSIQPPFKIGYIGETEKNIDRFQRLEDDFGPRFRQAAEYYQFELKD